MNRYVAFSDHYNGPVRTLGHDLRVGRFFVVPGGRYAYYENGHLNFENGEKRRVFRVWEGNWPLEEFDLSRVMSYINSIKNTSPRVKGKKFAKR